MLQSLTTIEGGHTQVKIKNWTDVPAQQAEGVEGVTVRWVISDQDDAPHFAMRVFDVQPGCSTPYHNHWWEHEVYVLDGEGVAVSKNGETPVSSGTVILVEGDETHRFRNTGDGVFRFICLIPFKWLEGLAATHRA
jgi:quercetin dioxygenase-like cupin family protein